MTHRIDLGARRRAAAGWLVAISSGTALIVALELLRPVHTQNAGTRAAIETVITICALVGAGLLLVRFERTRRMRDLLLLGALVIASLVDFPSSALPALVGMHSAERGSDAYTACQALVALAFAAAALTPAGLIGGGRTRTLTFAGLAGVSAIVLVDLTGLITSASTASGSGHPTGLSAAAAHPVGLGLQLASAALLLVAAAAFMRRPEHTDNQPHMLAAAAVMLAGARLQYLAIPVLGSDWVTPAAGLRIAAYALLLSAAIKHHARVHREAGQVAVLAERERIARDLHDGLAQDLAFIAAHSDRLADDFGGEHPLTIAARRALATSRGAMVDLAASAAPTTAAALKMVASELQTRFGVQVDVKFDLSGGAPDLDPVEREEVVRIAREAIVNAVKHGGASRITVELGSKGSDLLLRVSDDGCGIGGEVAGSGHGWGFGLPTMRARAASLGGRLVARRGAGGGTEVKVLV